jgi:hypothetical protein
MIPKKIFIPPFRLKYENMCFGQSLSNYHPTCSGGRCKSVSGFIPCKIMHLLNRRLCMEFWQGDGLYYTWRIEPFRFCAFLTIGVIADLVLSSLGYSNAIFCHCGRHKPELLVTKVGCKLCTKKGAAVRKSVRECKNFLIARQERTKYR